MALLAYASLALGCLVAAQAPQPPPATGSIRGMVMDRDGAVCEGAHVQLDSASTATQATISDANGLFVFANLPSGTFALKVTAGSFANESVSVSLSPGQDLEIEPVVVTPVFVSEVRVSASPTEIATMQLQDEEKQRVLGFIPNFTVVYVHNAPPLSSRQKFQLAWRSAIDPFTFIATGAAAGMEQANGTLKAYGGGVGGFAHRYGISYSDNFIGSMIGGALLPSLLKQDPRYFYKGAGSWHARTLYAIASSVICKSDNGHWQPNYSQFAGDFASAGISDLYYPANNRNDAAIILENSLLAKASDAIENIFQEFLVRRFTRNASKGSLNQP